MRRSGYSRLAAADRLCMPRDGVSANWKGGSFPPEVCRKFTRIREKRARPPWEVQTRSVAGWLFNYSLLCEIELFSPEPAATAKASKASERNLCPPSPLASALNDRDAQIVNRVAYVQ